MIRYRCRSTLIRQISTTLSKNSYKNKRTKEPADAAKNSKKDSLFDQLRNQIDNHISIPDWYFRSSHIYNAGKVVACLAACC